jgi:hypothetical protein
MMMMMNSIIKIKSFSEIKYQFGKFDIVAFDLDETIFTPKMKVLRTINPTARKNFLADIRKQVGEYTYAQLFDQLPYMVIEENIKLFIESLHQTGTGTIGFTARRTGQWTKYDPRTVQDKTLAILKSLDIVFNPIHFKDYVMVGLNTSNIEYTDQIIETGLDKYEITDDAMIKSNVIFTNNINKGIILNIIFEHFQFIPDTFVLIDDKESNLIALRDAIDFINKKYNTKIKCITYLYTGVIDLLDNDIDFRIIELQKKKLIEESIYLLDEVAYDFLENNPIKIE